MRTPSHHTVVRVLGLQDTMLQARAEYIWVLAQAEQVMHCCAHVEMGMTALTLLPVSDSSRYI